MSRFSGPQGKGAMREHRRTLAMGAFIRQFLKLKTGDKDFHEKTEVLKRRYLGPHTHLPRDVSYQGLVEELTPMLSGRSIKNVVEDL